jgi:hypothetical protein
MLQVNGNTVVYNNNKPHHAIPKQNHRQLVSSFNAILSAMSHTQRMKVEKETEALWVLINTSF